MRTSGTRPPLARTRATRTRAPARRIGIDENRRIDTLVDTVVVDDVVVVVGRIIVLASLARALAPRLSSRPTRRDAKRPNRRPMDGRGRNASVCHPSERTTRSRRVTSRRVLEGSIPTHPRPTAPVAVVRPPRFAFV